MNLPPINPSLPCGHTHSPPVSDAPVEIAVVQRDQRLEAHGKMHLVTAGSDSDMTPGWFSSDSKKRGAGDDRDFIGIHVGGPTRVGHCFMVKVFLDDLAFTSRAVQ